MKHLKANFRKAVDSGRRSGGGKIAMGLYNECCEIWSGSPAVESISFDIENSSIDTLDSMENRTLSDANQAEAGIDVETRETQPKNMAEVRRELVRNLKERRDSRLPKRLSVEAQLLDTAKQEITLKKRALERIEELDTNHNRGGFRRSHRSHRRQSTFCLITISLYSCGNSILELSNTDQHQKGFL